MAITRDTLLARVGEAGGSTRLSDTVRLLSEPTPNVPTVRAEIILGPHRYSFLLYQHYDGAAYFLPTESEYLRDAPALSGARTLLAQALRLRRSPP